MALAPAKLNLYLDVLGRRADGYHELESLFVALDWGDELGLRARTEPGVTLTLVSDAGGEVAPGAPTLAGAHGSLPSGQAVWCPPGQATWPCGPRTRGWPRRARAPRSRAWP